MNYSVEGVAKFCNCWIKEEAKGEVRGNEDWKALFSNLHIESSLLKAARRERSKRENLEERAATFVPDRDQRVRQPGHFSLVITKDAILSRS